MISIGAHATIDNNASSSARASFLQQILDLTDLTLSSGDCSLIDFFICFCWSFFGKEYIMFQRKKKGL